MKRLLSLVTVLTLSLALSAAPGAALAQEKVTVATITISLNNLPLYVAQERGYFANENLFVELVLLGASTRAIPALVGGSVHVSASSVMTTIRAIEKGAALKVVGGLVNGPTYDLIALPKYKSIKDLKGATIGVTGLVTSDTVLLKEMLKANGLEYPRDYGMLATIGRNAAVALLGRFKFWGYPAWVLWLVAHIFFLIGFRNRLIVLIEWAWAYWTLQRYARIVIGPDQRRS